MIGFLRMQEFHFTEYYFPLSWQPNIFRKRAGRAFWVATRWGSHSKSENPCTCANSSWDRILYPHNSCDPHQAKRDRLMHCHPSSFMTDWGSEPCSQTTTLTTVPSWLLGLACPWFHWYHRRCQDQLLCRCLC